jgi:predicted nucleotidyltransferase
MRLTLKQREVIVSTLETIFGKNSKIYLFGSRVDNTKRGGDIDLLVITEESLSSEELIRRKLKALAELYKKLGERKIDLLVTDYPQKEIEKIAVQSGILLNE